MFPYSWLPFCAAKEFSVTLPALTEPRTCKHTQMHKYTHTHSATCMMQFVGQHSRCCGQHFGYVDKKSVFTYPACQPKTPRFQKRMVDSYSSKSIIFSQLSTMDVSEMIHFAVLTLKARLENLEAYRCVVASSDPWRVIS